MAVDKDTVYRYIDQHTSPEPNSGCWLWLGPKLGKMGYGAVRVKKLFDAAHRINYERFVGPRKPGLVVMHTCDNPMCCNPKHLRLGTIKENNIDKKRKGHCANGQWKRIRESSDSFVCERCNEPCSKSTVFKYRQEWRCANCRKCYSTWLPGFSRDPKVVGDKAGIVFVGE